MLKLTQNSFVQQNFRNLLHSCVFNSRSHLKFTKNFHNTDKIRRFISSQTDLR